MMSNANGELSHKSCTFESVTWRIPNFSDLQSYAYLESPAFPFAGAAWSLAIHRNFIFQGQSGGYIDISLRRHPSSAAEHKVFIEMGFEALSGEEYGCLRSQHCFNGHTSKWFHFLFKDTSDLVKRRDELVPGGTLTVFCRLRLMESSSGETAETDLGENFSMISEESLHEADKEEESAVLKLQSDLKKLLERGEESDACLVVSGKEFKAHRCILGARSPVFNAMFNHDTEEKKSGRVLIDDLDPDSFHHFLEHVYTGRVEALSEQNAFGLYAAADKYDVQALKSDCVKYMQRTLSADSFCDVVTLAVQYQEKELMDLAVEFFKKNLGEIIRTVKWQVFMSENSTQANELFIKAVPPRKNQQ